jgi:uncharacterized protein YndB with AHSA1/START domain
MTASSAEGIDGTVVKTVVITRVFDAPRALVFEAWSKREHLLQWFGPKGFSLPTCDIDFRVGGALTVTMRSPDGEEFRSTGTFREIVVPERIVLESALLDENERPRFEDRNIITFAEHRGKTTVTVEANIIKLHDPSAVGAIEGMEEGWNQTLDRLAAHLATKH